MKGLKGVEEVKAPSQSIARERVLGRVLFIGLSASTAFLTVGLLLWMTAGREGVAPLLLRVGLMTLMATPVMRVIVAFVEYVRERDWVFAATTLAVLAVLAGTILVAANGGRL